MFDVVFWGTQPQSNIHVVVYNILYTSTEQ